MWTYSLRGKWGRGRRSEQGVELKEIERGRERWEENDDCARKRVWTWKDREETKGRNRKETKEIWRQTFRARGEIKRQSDRSLPQPPGPMSSEIRFSWCARPALRYRKHDRLIVRIRTQKSWRCLLNRAMPGKTRARFDVLRFKPNSDESIWRFEIEISDLSLNRFDNFRFKTKLALVCQVDFRRFRKFIKTALQSNTLLDISRSLDLSRCFRAKPLDGKISSLAANRTGSVWTLLNFATRCEFKKFNKNHRSVIADLSSYHVSQTRSIVLLFWYASHPKIKAAGRAFKTNSYQIPTPLDSHVFFQIHTITLKFLRFLNRYGSTVSQWLNVQRIEAHWSGCHPTLACTHARTHERARIWPNPMQLRTSLKSDSAHIATSRIACLCLIVTYLAQPQYKELKGMPFAARIWHAPSNLWARGQENTDPLQQRWWEVSGLASAWSAESLQTKYTASNSDRLPTSNLHAYKRNQTSIAILLCESILASVCFRYTNERDKHAGNQQEVPWETFSSSSSSLAATAFTRFLSCLIIEDADAADTHKIVRSLFESGHPCFDTFLHLQVADAASRCTKKIGTDVAFGRHSFNEYFFSSLCQQYWHS